MKADTFGPIGKNKYQPGLPPPVQRRAPVVCHLGNGAPRLSSWALGGFKGLPPGVEGPKVWPTLTPRAYRRLEMARLKRLARRARRAA